MSTSDSTMQHIAVGALLHDIGKLVQRAGIKSPNHETLLHEFTPVFKGRHTHHHSAYTFDFIEQKAALPKELFPNLTKIAKLSASHHLDNLDIYSLYIQIADRLSAGMDRIEASDTDEQTKGYVKKRLKSVWSAVKSHDKETGAHYELLPLDNASALFPKNKSDFDNFGKADLTLLYNKNLYQPLLNAHSLMKEQLQNQSPGFMQYYSWLLSTLEQYTWSVPSSTYRDIPDISLFDHSSTTAALAVALYRYFGDNSTEQEIKQKNIPCFRFIQGDFSGIQKHIFDFKAEGAKGLAKLLRGRSNYVTLLSKGIALSIIEALGLCRSNILSLAGGKFLILAPNTESTLSIVREMQVKIDEQLLYDLKGETTFIVNTEITAAQDDIGDVKKFEQIHSALSNSLRKAKTSKLSSVLSDKDGHFISERFIINETYPFGICEMTGKGPAANPSKESEPALSALAITQREIGHELAEADGCIWAPDDTLPIALIKGLLSIKLTKKEETESAARRSRDIWLMEILGHDTNSHNLPVAPKIGYVANTNSIPKFALEKEHDGTASFVELARCNQTEVNNTIVGTEILGLLKADVDNLGEIFSSGLASGECSLSRYSFMSRTIDYFFRDHLATVLEENGGWPIYTVYAGGDDLLMAGSLRHLYLFATEKLNPAFKMFTGNNPKVTISAAIGMFHSSAPIAHMTRITDELLDLAKKNPEKDSLAIQGVAMKWAKTTEVSNLTNWFDSQLKKGGKVTLNLIYRLLRYRAMAMDKSQKESAKQFAPGRWFLWNSQMTYDIARNVEPADSHAATPEAREIFDKLHEIRNKMAADPLFLEQLLIPITLASYYNRRRS